MCIERDKGCLATMGLPAEWYVLCNQSLLAPKTWRGKPYALRSEMRRELKGLRKDLRKHQERAVHGVLKSANVVLCTNVGAGTRLLGKALRGSDESFQFDTVVIDEAAQATEASCWIPIAWGRRVILAGDHHQLPPTVKSVAAEKKGLAVTLLDRVVRLLTAALALCGCITGSLVLRVLRSPSSVQPRRFAC